MICLSSKGWISPYFSTSHRTKELFKLGKTSKVIESISIAMCRKTASGNLVQFQLSVITGSSFSVCMRLPSSLGEAGLDSEARLDSEGPSPVWRVQQGLQLPNGISLARGGLGPLCLQEPAWSIHHLSCTVFPGLNVWWGIINLTQICVVWRSFLCKSPGSVSLSMQSLGHNCELPNPEPLWARNQSCVPACSFQQQQIAFYFYCEPSDPSRK